MFARTPSGGDLQIPLAIVTDPASCTTQKLADEFNLWRGSWAFDTLQGMPWFDQVLGVKQPSLTQVRALFRRALLSTPRVVAVNRLEFAYDPRTRNLQYVYEVAIDTGAIVPGGGGVVFAP